LLAHPRYSKQVAIIQVVNASLLDSACVCKHGIIDRLQSINNDHSMGYPDVLGFRAGTCSPYLFYDINMEVTTPLKVHPYAFNSEVAENMTKNKLKEDLSRLLLEVKEVKGMFRGVFRNQDFSRYANKDYYYTLLKQIHEIG